MILADARRDDRQLSKGKKGRSVVGDYLGLAEAAGLRNVWTNEVRGWSQERRRVVRVWASGLSVGQGQVLAECWAILCYADKRIMIGINLQRGEMARW